MGDPIFSTENLFFLKRSPKSGEKRMVILVEKMGSPHIDDSFIITHHVLSEVCDQKSRKGESGSQMVQVDFHPK